MHDFYLNEAHVPRPHWVISKTTEESAETRQITTSFWISLVDSVSSSIFHMLICNNFYFIIRSKIFKS